MKLGGGIGGTNPASDFSGSTLEYYNGSNYGLSSGPKRARPCVGQRVAQ
jgi:hypothetical protein